MNDFNFQVPSSEMSLASATLADPTSAAIKIATRASRELCRQLAWEAIDVVDPSHPHLSVSLARIHTIIVHSLTGNPMPPPSASPMAREGCRAH
jgi:hypothetical protein